MFKKISVIVLLLMLATMSVHAQTRTYTVQSGDTLQKIATRYGVTIQSIATANNITNINRILVGQVLVIPAVAPVASNRTYTVRTGDTLSQIAVRYNVTLNSLAVLNNITNASLIYVGQILVIPATGGPIITTPQNTTVPTVTGGRYLVQVGDTLSQIARRLGVDMYNIARANGILNLNQIYSGQSLVIPGR